VTDSHLLALRALNHWRPIHTQSYVGLRLALDCSIGRATDSEWFRDIAIRKSGTRKQPRYCGFQAVKEIGPDQRPKYRDFVAASPSTALAEAWCLHALSRTPSLANHKRSFSYLWPSIDGSARNYELYRDGYNRRNEAIRASLRENPRATIFVGDIRSFYPSISKRAVREELARRLGAAEIVGPARRAIDGVFGKYLEATEGPIGIALGPPLSHLLGHLALSRFDEQMNGRFGSRYFRYVDDIVIVVPTGSATDVGRLVASALEPLGLELHPDKSDVLTAEQWLRHGPSLHPATWNNSFEGLVQRLTLFLSRRPDAFDGLQKRFLGAGFSLPLGRFRTLARSGRFRRFWHSAAAGRLGWFLRGWLDDEDALLAEAQHLRTRFSKDLERWTHRPTPPGMMLGRWHSQRLRYLANRLIYLVPREQYPQLGDYLAGRDGVREAQVVLRALHANDGSSILPYPGAPVAAFAVVARESSSRPRVVVPDVPTRPIVDSLATLALHGLVDVPETFLARCNPADREVLTFCSGLVSRQQGLSPTISYADELSSLRMGRSQGEVRGLLDSRFDDHEEFPFDALRLGAGALS
jgi:hypothetical protein